MILMKDIIDEYHPNIRLKSAPIIFPLDAGDKVTLADLLEYVQNSIDEDLSIQYELRESVGIAAPQINIQKQLCVISAHDEDGMLHEHLFINPKIIRHSNFLTYLPHGEGCLSVNRVIEGIIPRFEKITVRNHDMDGNPYLLSFHGYIAVVVQHEIDHLNGILFLDKIDKSQPFAIPANSSPIVFASDELDEEL